jgi:hypothetical protein
LLGGRIKLSDPIAGRILPELMVELAAPLGLSPSFRFTMRSFVGQDARQRRADAGDKLVLALAPIAVEPGDSKATPVPSALELNEGGAGSQGGLHDRPGVPAWGGDEEMAAGQ